MYDLILMYMYFIELYLFCVVCLDLDGEFLLSFQTSSTAVTSQQQKQRSTSQYYLLSPVLANELDVSVEQQLSAKAKPPWLRHLPCLSTRQIDVELPDVTELQLGYREQIYV